MKSILGISMVATLSAAAALLPQPTLACYDGTPGSTIVQPNAPPCPDRAGPRTNATAAPKLDNKPRQTLSGIPIEEKAILFSDNRDALNAMDAMAKVVKAHGYRCSSISAFQPYLLSIGFTLTCNNFAYEYEFEDKGRGLEFRPPR